MKKIILGLILIASVLVAFKSGEFHANSQKKGILPNKKMLHVGIIVKDIEMAIDKWSDLLGLENRPKWNLAEGHEANPTHYRGKPSNAKAKLSFIQLDNIKIELIEPVGESSHWREFLNSKGEGVHHVAFEVEGIGEHYIKSFEDNHMPVLQQGGWNGGEYGYMDSVKPLGVTIELIENYVKETK